MVLVTTPEELGEDGQRRPEALAEHGDQGLGEGERGRVAAGWLAGGLPAEVQADVHRPGKARPAGVSGDECCHPDRDEQPGQFDAELGDIAVGGSDRNHRVYSSFSPAKSAGLVSSIPTSVTSARLAPPAWRMASQFVSACRV